ncbi:hypothetical protein AMES_6084 [Amycolatopsis mediterranei S699]|uniref:Uncharacterized protein n=2 Tax=Amycolatopsis mediterranei TaxID=33910 RepID=A0A0H3DA77_AMYMU|nr:hypothetical protein [Amycolatopsis mediterranei]ADJ47910.1 hypothetical protein AMED_6174 [Amycolatopsis mediterranei U32]AEK44805.1 hypothetical protein RAM_31650 [Amycolatopsis mediterranei S699]AFO79620.1 hypothetical protein AMES_6084 [Amycolatopsis mediterranei S699]AGT86748.1 hypothetical protein B737_6084 [Amycolatopsis mediterranei RB]KDO11009.1 hypothetical protein DV26_09715 [Amycolatopsis mediterranei]
MSKSPFKIKTGGGATKRLIALVAVCALLAMVIKHPHDAADMVNTAADHGGGIIDSVVQFLRDLTPN